MYTVHYFFGLIGKYCGSHNTASIKACGDSSECSIATPSLRASSIIAIAILQLTALSNSSHQLIMRLLNPYNIQTNASLL